MLNDVPKTDPFRFYKQHENVDFPEKNETFQEAYQGENDKHCDLLNAILCHFLHLWVHAYQSRLRCSFVNDFEDVCNFGSHLHC